MYETKVPKSVLKNLGITTQREFKQLKRYQLRMAKKAFADFRLGCAYCPGGAHRYEAYNYLEKLEEDLSVKKWGR